MTARSDIPPDVQTDPVTMVVIISGRRLLAEALGTSLTEGCGAEVCRVVHDEQDLLSLPAVQGRSVWLIDLDHPGVNLEVIEATVPAVLARRIGFYDAFTTRHAETAFALALTVLLPLTSTLDHLCGSVFGDRRRSSATQAQGLSRSDLARLASLTPRQIEVLRTLAEGLSVSSAARLLGVTTHTVETHKRRTFEKLGVQQQAHAVALAAAAGLVLPD